ncbi:gpi anchored dioxygenase [Seiridium cupressi]
MRRAATVAKHRKPLYTDTPDTTIFTSNDTCVLNPQGETGPYWVKREYIRNSLREDQPGVPIVVEAQSVDVETCEPIKDLYRLVTIGNGNTEDLSNYMRPSFEVSPIPTVTASYNSNQFSHVTTHHHIVAHLNATVLPNNTLMGSSVAHVGQIFLDQDIINESGSIAKSGGTVGVDGGSGDGGAASGKNGTAPWGSFSGTIPSGTAVPSTT